MAPNYQSKASEANHHDHEMESKEKTSVGNWSRAGDEQILAPETDLECNVNVNNFHNIRFIVLFVVFKIAVYFCEENSARS